MASYIAEGCNPNNTTDDLECADYIHEHANEILEKLLDDLILGVAFSEHYESRAEAASAVNEQADNVDVLGQPLNKVPDAYCDCPECGYKIAASRFAPHLAKCLGKGRASSRAASQRIADESSADNIEDMKKREYGEMEVDSDEEWLPKKCDGKKRRSKGDSRNTYVTTKKDTKQAYEGMTYESKRILLQKICGVVSNQTGRYCMRSMKCPHHSNEERSSVRDSVLDQIDQAAGSSTMGAVLTNI